jgi:hypothetical protein
MRKRGGRRRGHCAVVRAPSARAPISHRQTHVHISAVERTGLNGLNEGQKISYDVQQDRGKDAAVNLKV